MATATQNDIRVAVTDGPGMWHLFIEGLVRGERNLFQFSFNGQTVKLTLRICAVESLNRQNGLWRIQAKRTGTVFVKPGSVLLANTLQRMFDRDTAVPYEERAISIVYTTLERKGYVE